jgi:hypothetical protein
MAYFWAFISDLGVKNDWQMTRYEKSQIKFCQSIRQVRDAEKFICAPS